MNIKTTLIVIAVFLSVQLQAQPTAEFSYREISQSDIDEVQAIWKSRDLSAKNVEVIKEEIRDRYTVKIIKHTLLARTHYGAIVIPNTQEKESLPVVVVADGLWQDNPSLNADLMIIRNQGRSPLAGFIQIYPSYRGRILLHQGQTYYSEGDYADAYDGAADDTIGFLNVAESLIPQGRFDKVAIYGHSRGGTVALLLAARDPRINTVLAVAAPVDFYRQDVGERWRRDGQRYGIQYTWQFFNGKEASESRQRMLASSPIYFAPHANVENIFLLHGASDTNVPPWNTDEMETHLKSFNKKVDSRVFDDRDHMNIFQDADFFAEYSASFDIFLSNLKDTE